MKKGRKARLKAKRAAKQRERQAGSDDDDIPAADGFKVRAWAPRCCSAVPFCSIRTPNLCIQYI